MKYIFCTVGHNPPRTYGDCLRACFASILSLESDQVPHFFYDDCDGETGRQRIVEWLGSRNLGLIRFVVDGSSSLEELLEGWGFANPETPVILIGSTVTGDHAVILKGCKIEHNPAWSGSKIIRPHSTGHWQIWTVAAL